VIKERKVIGDATLYLADCREVLIAADAVVADPPYGIDLEAMCGTDRNRAVKYKRPYSYKVHGDDEPFDPARWLEYPKVILWGGIHFAQRLPESRCWLVWDKREGTTSDNQADCEIAWTNLPGPARLHSQLWRGIVRRGEENVSREDRTHPMQKPIGLMQWCISLCKLAPGSVVLDPYMGSGSTGVAALRAGMKFIGVEIDPGHFRTACDRIDQSQRQGRLIA
jgi:site-specific DNA-methyltransferase (adenine-specific)